MLLSTGWQPDVFREVPWLYAAATWAWWWVLVDAGGYEALDGYVRERFGDMAAGPIVAWTLHMVFYHGIALVHCFMDNVEGPWTKLKTHRNDKRSWKDLIGNVVMNQVIFLAMACIFFSKVTQRGYERYAEPIPPFWKVLADGLVTYIIYEALFYTGHRILHIRDLTLFGHRFNLYKMWHHTHHTTFASVGVSALYMHPMDFFFTQAIPQLAPPLIVNFHPIVVWMGVLIGSMNAVHTHGCYNFWGTTHTLEHDLHHQKYSINFGTGPMDLLLGTYVGPLVPKTMEALNAKGKGKGKVEGKKLE